ncbi:hypothetical protein MF672_001735 [Actinomadura sp. ATCC 31491]|uniref:Uncharacterized protein n=1 Tax=Actinomadura luzonensis TaxID=2805427 RepID=A0ABT0FJQ7_9ACTN|nr:hypothetical protein [Actinomadura luzonensis]MCK2212527.1 hypothetical protein [Actinomadura luzonensis]
MSPSSLGGDGTGGAACAGGCAKAERERAARPSPARLTAPPVQHGLLGEQRVAAAARPSVPAVAPPARTARPPAGPAAEGGGQPAGQRRPPGRVPLGRRDVAADGVRQAALRQQRRALGRDDHRARVHRAVRDPGRVQRDQRARGLHQGRGRAGRVDRAAGQEVGQRRADRLAGEQPHLLAGRDDVRDRDQAAEPAQHQPLVGHDRRHHPLAHAGQPDEPGVEQQGARPAAVG